MTVLFEISANYSQKFQIVLSFWILLHTNLHSHFVQNTQQPKLPSLQEINQQIVRLNANSGAELIANDDLLLELAEQFVSQDTPLAMGYLLSLSKV